MEVSDFSEYFTLSPIPSKSVTFIVSSFTKILQFIDVSFILHCMFALLWWTLCNINFSTSCREPGPIQGCTSCAYPRRQDVTVLSWSLRKHFPSYIGSLCPDRWQNITVHSLKKKERFNEKVKMRSNPNATSYYIRNKLNRTRVPRIRAELRH